MTTRNMFPEGGPHDPSATQPLAAATWNVRQASSASSKYVPVGVQGWPDSGVLDAKAVVDGLAQDEVELLTGDVLGGEARPWHEAGSRTPTGTGLATPSLPEFSGWPPNGGYRGAFSLTPMPEGDHDAEKGSDGGAGVKDGCRITLDSFPMSGVSLKTAPLTSCETRVSARNVRIRFTFSPTSLAEDAASVVEEESPSPPSPTSPPSPSVVERDDYLMHEDKGSGDEADTSPGEERFGEMVEDVMAAVPAGDEKCSDERTGNVLDDDDADNQYQDMDEYVDTQHAFLREKELELALRSSYLDESGRPGAVTAASRTALLDWLRRLHAVVPTTCRNAPEFSQETLFLATNILDRFLSLPEARGKLLKGGYHPELAAASALGLAAKLEDAEVPSLWYFAAASKSASGSTGGDDSLARCSQTWGEGRPAGSRCECDVCEARVQLVRVEGLITSALGFRMMAPTAMSFLGIYLARARRLGGLRSSNVMEKLRIEVVETLWSVVRDTSSFNFRPSELAAAALYLASSDASASTPLPFDLLAITGMELTQLQGCVSNMRRVKASAPTFEEEVPHRGSAGGCTDCGSLEHADDDIRHLGDGGGYARGGPGTLGAEGGYELRGGASRAGGMEVYGVEAGYGLMDIVRSLGGLGTGSLFSGGDAFMSGGMEVSDDEVGGGFVDGVLRLEGLGTGSLFDGGDTYMSGGMEVPEQGVCGGFVANILRPEGLVTGSGFSGGGDTYMSGYGGFGGDDPYVSGGIEVSELEMDSEFTDGVLRLGGLDINSGPWGGAPGVGDMEVFELGMGDGFADSVLRLGGVETSDGLEDGGVTETSWMEVHGEFADSVLRLGGVETSDGLGSVFSLCYDA